MPILVLKIILMPNASYDFDKNDYIEEATTINVDSILDKLWKSFLVSIKTEGIDINGVKVKVTKTKTNFEGSRHWFTCPTCKKRVKLLYSHPRYNTIACRDCLGLKYLNKHKRILKDYEKTNIRLQRHKDN